jgi:hypothetical protein
MSTPRRWCEVCGTETTVQSGSRPLGGTPPLYCSAECTTAAKSLRALVRAIDTIVKARPFQTAKVFAWLKRGMP